jgi:HAD superfamily hydrolase (TIGR01509 family)
MPLTAMIFDVDGTLIDSNDAHAQSWVDTLRADGVEVDFAKVRRCIGMGSDKLLPEVAGIEAESERGKRLSEQRAKSFRRDHFPKLRAFPGTRELFEHLIGQGLRVGIATSARGDELEKLLDLARVGDLIEEHASSDDVENSKPDPDIVQAALSQLGCSPDEALMVGDTPYDLAAAARSGVSSIAFRCGGWNDDDLRSAIAIFDGPWAMRAGFDREAFERTARRRGSA